MSREPSTAVLQRGVFTVSLDFELAWGTRGRRKAGFLEPYYDGTRQAIDGLLCLCERYEVQATWAVVGALLLGTAQEDEKHPWLGNAEFDDVPPGNAVTHPRWYAEDVLEKIRSCAVEQEIACHTLTHRFVDAGPAGKAAFACELDQSIALFDQLCLPRPVTFIYPKAQMGHFDLLQKKGFKCFRGPEPGWFESLPGTIPSALVRFADARLGWCPQVGFPKQSEDGLWVIPSSQFYSPKMSVGRYVSINARVAKARKGLDAAARGQMVYHLWTHPFNLGCDIQELLSGLERIFRHAAKLRDQGRLEVLSMDNLTDRCEGSDSTVSGCSNETHLIGTGENHRPEKVV